MIFGCLFRFTIEGILQKHKEFLVVSLFSILLRISMRVGSAPLNPHCAFHAIFCNLCAECAKLLFIGPCSPGVAIISVMGTQKAPG